MNFLKQLWKSCTIWKLRICTDKCNKMKSTSRMCLTFEFHGTTKHFIAIVYVVCPKPLWPKSKRHTTLPFVYTTVRLHECNFKEFILFRESFSAARFIYQNLIRHGCPSGRWCRQERSSPALQHHHSGTERKDTQSVNVGETKWSRSEFEVTSTWNRNELELELESKRNRIETNVKSKRNQNEIESESKWHRSEIEVKSKWDRSDTEAQSQRNRNEIAKKSKWHRSEFEGASKWNRSDIAVRPKCICVCVVFQPTQPLCHIQYTRKMQTGSRSAETAERQ